MSVRVLLGDDHPLVRRELRQAIESEPSFRVVAEAGDGAEAVKQALAKEADLAILDVAMPRMTGLQAAEQLARCSPRTKLLLLSMYDNDQYLFAAARAGAAGYLLKSVADEEVLGACKAVLSGGSFLLPPGTSQRTRERVERLRRGEVERDDLLTPRETEVLKLVAEGYSSQKIADSLVISIKTVEHHRASIIKKLGIRDRATLTGYAIRRGLVQP